MTRWGKFGFAVCASVALMAGTASADLLTFDVIPAFAPKGPESPNWNNYVLNAISGIQAKTNIGDRETSAAAYETVAGPIGPEEMVYTPFNSWRGKADPNPEFVAPFLGEHGNRIHFGLHIVGTDTWDFALSEITWELDSDDSTDFFDQSGDLSAANYSPTRVGIDYGADGMRGGGDDMILNSGEAGSTLVNELIYVGVGDGFLSSEPDSINGQDDINTTLADILAGCVDKSGGCPVNLTGTYTVPDHDGNRMAASGSIVINLVPEPSAGLLSLIGFFATAAFGRRRR